MSVKKLSELDEIAGLASSDLLETSQSSGGYISKKITFANVASSVVASSYLDNTKTTAIGITIDNGLTDITTGVKGYCVIPYSGLIKSWSMVASGSGSIVIDVWKANGSIPTVANTITGTEKPTLSSQQMSQDSNLTTWTTAIGAGDVVGYSVDSCSNIKKLTLTIEVYK
jgi:hypothetical protein